MSDKAPVLEFRGVNIHYGPVHVLKDIDLSINAGELVCLLGGNASGKTTTLKTILGWCARLRVKYSWTGRLSRTTQPQRSCREA